MAEFLWHWTKGDTKVYTCEIEKAEQALQQGFMVLGERIKPMLLDES